MIPSEKTNENCNLIQTTILEMSPTRSYPKKISNNFLISTICSSAFETNWKQLTNVNCIVTSIYIYIREELEGGSLISEKSVLGKKGKNYMISLSAYKDQRFKLTYLARYKNLGYESLIFASKK